LRQGEELLERGTDERGSGVGTTLGVQGGVEYFVDHPDYLVTALGWSHVPLICRPFS
jgi:hypothetical protein